VRYSDDDPYTYFQVGATSDDELPAGYGHVRRSRVIGEGEVAFIKASRELMHWEVQHRAGLTVRAVEPVTVDEIVWLGLAVGSLRLGFRCRVVYVVDEPRRKGFAYGTLRGHPEAGEEAFILVWRDDDVVELQVIAFSKPAAWWARIGGPATTFVQTWVTDRYLKALS
jgi:uncharacterized protein (UPF0548 family)